LTLFLLLLDYYVIRPILFYYIFDCPNPASGLQYRNKRIVKYSAVTKQHKQCHKWQYTYTCWNKQWYFSFVLTGLLFQSQSRLVSINPHVWSPGLKKWHQHRHWWFSINI